MTNIELVNILKDIALNKKTLYVMGCFGAPLYDSNKPRYISAYPYNSTTDRKSMIESASADTFGFDCVNLIKAVLWGWDGDLVHIYGGAEYVSNNVPDINADQMYLKCTERSSIFTDIPVGAFLYTTGHCGIYIGDGLAVECTPLWKNGVQITAVGNISPKTGYSTRTWSAWGLLPYITYTQDSPLKYVKMGYMSEGDIFTISDILIRLNIPFSATNGYIYTDIPISEGDVNTLTFQCKTLSIPIISNIEKINPPVIDNIPAECVDTVQKLIDKGLITDPENYLKDIDPLFFDIVLILDKAGLF